MPLGIENTAADTSALRGKSKVRGVSPDAYRTIVRYNLVRPRPALETLSQARLPDPSPPSSATLFCSLTAPSIVRIPTLSIFPLHGFKIW